MVDVDVLKKTRFFGGKEYWLYGTAEEEDVAKSVASTMRESDCYARVTKARGYWKIWIREKE